MTSLSRDARLLRRALRGLLAATAIPWVLARDPAPARADIGSDRIEAMMYGRMGIGWTKSGQLISGRYMNLGTKRAIGGRLEEGDYLQPGFRFHLKKAE